MYIKKVNIYQRPSHGTSCYHGIKITSTWYENHVNMVWKPCQHGTKTMSTWYEKHVALIFLLNAPGHVWASKNSLVMLNKYDRAIANAESWLHIALRGLRGPLIEPPLCREHAMLKYCLHHIKIMLTYKEFRYVDDIKNIKIYKWSVSGRQHPLLPIE